LNRTVLSAQRGGHDLLRHVVLGRLLAALGFPAEEVLGRWCGRPELAWEITDLPSPLALVLAALFEQEAVLANGFLYELGPIPSAPVSARPVLRIEEGRRAGTAPASTRRADGWTWRAVLGPPCGV
jgi:hypothetical protein